MLLLLPSRKLFEHSVHGYVHNSEAQSSRRVCRDCSGTCICSTLVDMKLSGGHPFALLVYPVCACVCAPVRVSLSLFSFPPSGSLKRQQKKNFITLVRSPCKFPCRDDPAAFIISFYALSRVSCKSSLGRFSFARTVSLSVPLNLQFIFQSQIWSRLRLEYYFGNRKHNLCLSHSRRSPLLRFAEL
jgi:hypothetical protein